MDIFSASILIKKFKSSELQTAEQNSVYHRKLYFPICRNYFIIISMFYSINMVLSFLIYVEPAVQGLTD